MITINNEQQAVAFDIESYRAIAQAMLKQLEYPEYDLGIMLATPEAIQRFNRQYRTKDKPTDILSFAYHQLEPGQRIAPETDDDKNLGDLIICPEYARDDLPRWNRTFEQHMVALLAHGIAHLLGYDHETDDEFEVMNRVEQQLIAAVEGMPFRSFETVANAPSSG